MTREDRKRWRGHFFAEAADLLRQYAESAEVSAAAIDAQPDAADIWAIRDEVVTLLEKRADGAPDRFIKVM